MSAEQVVVTTVGSWWRTPSIADPSPCSAVPAPCVPDKGVTLQPIGGARAQSRFSGRTAKPIYREAPVDGAPLVASVAQPGPAPALGGALSAAQRSQQLWEPRGHTCDGSSAAGGVSRWRFNLAAWRWEVAGDEAPGEQLAQHGIAARRWGDGRDALGPAALRRDGRQAPPPPKRRAVVAGGASFEAVDPTDPAAHGFASVGGFDRQKKTLEREILTPLRHPTLCARLGLKAGRGVLLTGPPGSGKTHLARALATEAGLHLEAVAGAECVGGGAAEERLRRAFAAAAAAAPCVLFIDEIDAAAPARGLAGVSDAERQATALVLSLLDSLRRSGAAVAVVAASNRPDAVDPALRRPGRLDVELAMGPPGSADREAVLRAAARAVPLAGDVDLGAVAGRLQGYMAADVAAVAPAAALRCVGEAVAAAEADGTLGALVCGDPGAMAGVAVAARHFDAAIADMAPAVLRGLAAEVPRDVAWGDVGGLEGVKNELQEMVEWPLVHGERLAAMGMAPPAGALLYGPPGCGKTLLAKAVAGCCGANFVSVRGPELLQKWLGESEAAVRGLFAAARAAAPCVIFLDEVDALAPRRDGAGGGAASGGDAAAARVLNQLLCELDGVAPVAAAPVFVLAATNRPAALDPALLRPGRLDRALKVPLPDAGARAAILAAALRRCPAAPGLDLAALAAGEAMEGFSGADVVEAARRAGTALVREAIAADTAGDAAAAAAVRLEPRHLEAALAGMRRSVSSDEAQYHDSVEEKLREGSLAAGDVFGAEARRAQVAAVATAVQAACGKQAAGLLARVAQLEAALRAAGAEVPDAAAAPPAAEQPMDTD